MPTSVVIDDHPELRELAAMTLRHGRYKVTEAADGEAGTRLVAALLPDLVVTDILMRNQDGFDVLRAAKQLSKPPKVIVVFGGRGCLERSDYSSLARELGAAATLAKPFSPGDLLRRAFSIVARC